MDHLQQARRRDGHTVSRGHDLLAQLPRYVLHYSPLVKDARLKVKIPEVPLYSRADTIRKPSIQRVLGNFLARQEKVVSCIVVASEDVVENEQRTLIQSRLCPTPQQRPSLVLAFSARTALTKHLEMLEKPHGRHLRARPPMQLSPPLNSVNHITSKIVALYLRFASLT